MHPFRLALVALLGISVASAREAGAQFTNEVAVVRDGVRFLVRPSVTINTTETGVVQVTLTQIHARVDESYGVVVDGVREAYTAFNRGLVSNFSAIRVTSLSLGITFTGVEGCSGRVGLAVWREGERMTLGCNRGGRAQLTGFTVNGLSTSGVLELQSEVRQRRAVARRDSLARVQQARQDSIARARAEAERLAAQRAAQQQATRQQASSAGSASSAGATTAGASTSSAAAGAASATASTAASAEERQRQAEAAEAERRRQEARAQAAEAARAAAQYEQQRQELNRTMDEAATQVAGAVMGMAEAIAYNRRVDQARRERLAAAERERVAQYRAAALARYAQAPEGTLCAAVSPEAHPRARFGTAISGSLTMSSCRTPQGHNTALHRVTVPSRTWVKLGFNSTAFNGTLNIRRADGQPVAVRGEFWAPPGDYIIEVGSSMRGEVGAYSVAFERAPRAAIGDYVWGVGGDAFSLDVPYEMDGAAAAFVFRAGLRPGQWLELFGEGGAGGAFLSGEVGGRVYLQSAQSRGRFFAQGSYGYFSVNRTVNNGLFDSYENGTGTGFTAGLGWEFTVSTPGTAGAAAPGTIEIGVYQTSADLTGEFEAPFKATRLRIAMNLHNYLK